jgi:ribosomal protein S12 methylthiotransferase
VEGAAANALPGAVPEPEKQARLEVFMAKQAGISAGRLQARVGRRETVLVDGHDEEGTLVARSRGDAPEIDGVVYVEDVDAPAGSFLEVEITGATEHDLFAQAV